MTSLYRDYDQAELDKQYNARATVPDIAPILKQYETQSAHARATLDGAIGVAYGDHPDEVLDVFRAADRAGPAPVFFFIHGGYWRLLTKDESSGMAPTFTAAGAVVVSISYSLAPAVTLDRIVDQTRRAFAWVHANIAQYGGDPARIHVCGTSAGGHLTGMLLASGWHDAYGVPADAVRGAAPLSGLFDLRPLPHTHINAWMKLSADDAMRNSPIDHLPTQGCPLIVSYGGNETDEFKRQSRDYLAAWRAQGFDGRDVPMPHTNHFDIVLALNDPSEPLTHALFEQMGLVSSTPNAAA